MRAWPPPREGLHGKRPGLRQPPAEARGGSTSAETLRLTRPSLHPLPTASPKAYGCPACGWVPLIPGGPAARPPGGAPPGAGSLPAQAPASPTWGCGRWPGLAGGELTKLLSRPQQTPPGEGPGQVSPLRRSSGSHRVLACPLHCWARRILLPGYYILMSFCLSTNRFASCSLVLFL